MTNKRATVTDINDFLKTIESATSDYYSNAETSLADYRTRTRAISIGNTPLLSEDVLRKTLGDDVYEHMVRQHDEQSDSESVRKDVTTSTVDADDLDDLLDVDVLESAMQKSGVVIDYNESTSEKSIIDSQIEQVFDKSDMAKSVPTSESEQLVEAYIQSEVMHESHVESMIAQQSVDELPQTDDDSQLSAKELLEQSGEHVVVDLPNSNDTTDNESTIDWFDDDNFEIDSRVGKHGKQDSTIKRNVMLYGSIVIVLIVVAFICYMLTK